MPAEQTDDRRTANSSKKRVIPNCSVEKNLGNKNRILIPPIKNPAYIKTNETKLWCRMVVIYKNKLGNENIYYKSVI